MNRSSAHHLPPAKYLLLWLATALLSAASSSQAPALEIVVPAYFYPGRNSPWVEMTAAADDAPITAIMNPGNGPGNVPDNNYVSAVNAFRAAGGRVIGYVYSSYGNRPLAEVTADIDRYAAWYAIDGIFVDEMANTGPAERLNYYKSIYDHAKTKDPKWEVMGNPGTHTIEAYADWPTADRLMVFENTGAQSPPYVPSPWTANYDSDRFVHLVHTEPSAENMAAALDLALQRNAGGIYITDDVMNNPWDRLPTYWQAEVAAVAAINSTIQSADFNEDGQVDFDDLSRWQSNVALFAAGAFRRHGDANGDGAVDGADLLLWQQQATSQPPVGVASPAAIPEPASLSLVLAGACFSRRRLIGSLTRPYACRPHLRIFPPASPSSRKRISHER
ncbi:MAG: hypothetical protein IT424_04550 [Pirellulales bacterium]|nr:hypothetical protein [Pirellulales bacterium]